ncbi:MAG TPA: hypothetical protein PKO06_21855, partial [Candidatus Ozemobacteraceae bacterium]|nr:hypothetical protein [Candidatus Ozemobacteraceae bacterium]
MRFSSKLLLFAILSLLLPAATQGASFLVTTQADFLAAGSSLSDVLASTTEGLNADYLRIINTNPGLDDGFPAKKFTNGGTRVWNKKRAIQLEIPVDGTARANRYNEKVMVEISRIGGAKSDWADLRLTDFAGNPIDFGLVDFETPVDNTDSIVKLLFQANATGTFASATYWIYYGNQDATNVATTSISRFYLTNHDFEDGMNGWTDLPAPLNAPVAAAVAPVPASPLNRDTRLYTNIENDLSLVPPG